MPYAVERLPDELHYTYLDTVGRPVIVLKKANLVEQHIQDFEVCIFKQYLLSLFYYYYYYYFCTIDSVISMRLKKPLLNSK